LDIGSGAGFPGLVIAVLAKRRFPNLQVTLIESDKRKCVFLNEVVRELDLNVKTVSKRIEDCPPQDADVISARALTQLENLLLYFILHGRFDCKGLFLKGKSTKSEIESVKNIDMFRIKLSASEVDKTGYLIEVGKKEN
jgi:16S rRNA (guanine527-N7)-methyltransferase